MASGDAEGAPERAARITPPEVDGPGDAQGAPDRAARITPTDAVASGDAEGAPERPPPAADAGRVPQFFLTDPQHTAGLTLVATDAEWRHGRRPQVTSSAEALTVAVTGRAAALDGLDGPGVAVLRART